jgi:hypothetical protein
MPDQTWFTTAEVEAARQRLADNRYGGPGDLHDLDAEDIHEIIRVVLTATWQSAVAEGRRQATEGFEVREEWAISYTLNGNPCEPAHGGHVFDSREEAERHLDAWRRHYPDLTYADEVYHRREVMTGPWEPAEQTAPDFAPFAEESLSLAQETFAAQAQALDPETFRQESLGTWPAERDGDGRG